MGVLAGFDSSIGVWGQLDTARPTSVGVRLAVSYAPSVAILDDPVRGTHVDLIGVAEASLGTALRLGLMGGASLRILRMPEVPLGTGWMPVVGAGLTVQMPLGGLAVRPGVHWLHDLAPMEIVGASQSVTAAADWIGVSVGLASRRSP